MIYGLIGFGIIVLVCTVIIFVANLDACPVDDVGICLVLSFIGGLITTLEILLFLALTIIVISSPFWTLWFILTFI